MSRVPCTIAQWRNYGSIVRASYPPPYQSEPLFLLANLALNHKNPKTVVLKAFLSRVFYDNLFISHTSRKITI